MAEFGGNALTKICLSSVGTKDKASKAFDLDRDADAAAASEKAGGTEGESVDCALKNSK
jgi:hypothetical protein